MGVAHGLMIAGKPLPAWWTPSDPMWKIFVRIGGCSVAVVTSQNTINTKDTFHRAIQALGAEASRSYAPGWDSIVAHCVSALLAVSDTSKQGKAMVVGDWITSEFRAPNALTGSREEFNLCVLTGHIVLVTSPRIE